jgi:gamma-glutamyltranspeptidase/glutathione hydrolase
MSPRRSSRPTSLLLALLVACSGGSSSQTQTTPGGRTIIPAGEAPRPAPPPQPIVDKGSVAAPEPLASQVGAEILRRGGNAVDAAIAVGFAIAVTFPNAGNLGGGGFMLVHLEGGGHADEAIDYRETAPAAATRDMFLDAKGKVVEGLSTGSHKASGVPGTVAGLWMAHQRHGTLPWRDLVMPAVELARADRVYDPRSPPRRRDSSPPPSSASPTRGATASTPARPPGWWPRRCAAAAASSPRPISPAIRPSCARPFRAPIAITSSSPCPRPARAA